MAAVTDAPCAPWQPTWCVDLATVSPSVLAATGIGVQVASELLWTLSGRRFGLCPNIIRPCRRSCWPAPLPAWGWWTTSTSWTGWPWPINLGGGVWVNCGCSMCGDTCSCNPLSEVVLPYPVASISSVVIDGSTLPASGYALHDHQILVRTDGGMWPLCNDLTKQSGLGAWSITATYGVQIPPSGQLAVGQLALEIAKFCAGADCILPRSVTQIVRQGVTKTFDSRSPRLVFGLAFVDSFLASHNPGGATARAQIFDIDGPRPRATNTGGP